MSRLLAMLPDLSRLDPLFRPGPTANWIATCSFLVMLLGALGTVRTGRWWWRLILLGGAMVWPLPDHPLQGPVLLSLSYSHGVHLADLLSVVAAVTAVLPWRHLIGSARSETGVARAANQGR